MFAALARPVTFMATAAVLATLAACGGPGESAPAATAPAAPGAPAAPAPISIGTGTPVIGDVPLGSETAPVTLIEYAALTCHVCRDFAKQVLPRIKSTYIDTGKVRYVYRDFPLEYDQQTGKAVDGFGVLLSSLARCKGPEKFHEVLDGIFVRQADLLDAARTGEAAAVVAQIAQTHGISTDEATACLDNQPALRAAIKASRDEGAAAGVTGTPGIFINGVRFEGAPNWESVSAEIEKQLAAVAGTPAAPAPAAAPPADAAAPAPAAPAN